MPFVVAFCLFFFLEVSPKQYKVTWGKIKASLFHSWVIVTDGHVRSAKTNSSSDKHPGFERWRRKIFARFPIHSWLWKESNLLLRDLAPPKEGQWNTTDGRNVTPTERGRGCWIHISSHWAGGWGWGSHSCPLSFSSLSPGPIKCVS